MDITAHLKIIQVNQTNSKKIGINLDYAISDEK